MLTSNHGSRTNRSFVSFYNREAERELEKYVEQKQEKEDDNSSVGQTGRPLPGPSRRLPSDAVRR
ncbi:hypothetical protein AKJ57_03845 [candidate division MSBL1 archaeon SCGC-AAA259A05]|uniref:Uncharacterized protein n=1 Tax=candidate division MSBL1 archaeon SCGC-AAA259A05 TaxID=1698259 RepID=A0A133U983_9EURY|nr:hypothetical protein AKJ57_03845 [candidate division MSBL1 archaeon SCGC-AAA259A05]